MGNLVAIVGRPNVGKSTLFNRFTETKRAIVNEEAGVTRDRQYGKVFWNGKDFSIVDTGGYVLNSDDIFEEEIRKQVMLAIDEADAILFVVDVKNGITDMDLAVAEILRRSKKKVYLVVNKVDNTALINDAFEFYNLGLGEYFNISSINGSGTGDLLDKVVDDMEFKDDDEYEEEIPRFAVVGRPNAGKSSIINAFMGEDRNIVTDIAGTTRDSIYTRYNKFGHDFYLVDTAGVRKKGKVNEDLEYYSVIRAIKAIENSDVCIMMVDAERGIESQDMNIYNVIQKNKKGLVLVVNKWDLIEKETDTAKKYEAAIKERFAPFTDFPVVFASATTKQRIHRVIEEALRVHKNRIRKIPTSKLNDVMLKAIERFNPPSVKDKYIKIKYVTQLPTHTPVFAFYANLPQYVKDPYKRYLENQIRKNWEFTGSTVQVFMRKK